MRGVQRIRLTPARAGLAIASTSEAEDGAETTRLYAGRRSRLFPDTRLAYGDFHNHTLLSDGNGDPAHAFDSMRRAGLDVAAITDHALYRSPEPMDEMERLRGGYVRSLTDAGWRQVGELAAQALATNSFVALRGFEWTSPRLGHMNVWFSTHWVDTLSTDGYRDGDALLTQIPPHAFPPGYDPSRLAAHKEPMEAWYSWLRQPVEDGGGRDGLIGFNHPGREAERFAHFTAAPSLRERVVSLEMFNREDDYLLRGVAEGFRSPLVECLDAGWRVGLIGVSDDHSANWGFSERYGRTGLWVRELTREGVREALLARRVFATRQRGLRLDAAANGVRMGGDVIHTGGQLRITLDLDGGADWWGRRLGVQVLGQGPALPEIKWAGSVVVPGADEPPIQFDLELAADETRWLVVRVTDPDRPEPTGLADLDQHGAAIAYTSPFFLGGRFSGVAGDALSRDDGHRR